MQFNWFIQLKHIKWFTHLNVKYLIINRKLNCQTYLIILYVLTILAIHNGSYCRTILASYICGLSW
jgi:hypothetical protein